MICRERFMSCLPVCPFRLPAWMAVPRLRESMSAMSLRERNGRFKSLRVL